MYYTYIIYSEKLNKFYIGSTKDLKQRIIDHNRGAVPFTANGIKWILVFYEAFLEKQDSIREEKFLKTGKGRERRKYLLETYLKNNSLE